MTTLQQACNVVKRWQVWKNIRVVFHRNNNRRFWQAWNIDH